MSIPPAPTGETPPASAGRRSRSVVAALVFSAVLIVCGSVVTGLWSGRWQSDDDRRIRALAGAVTQAPLLLPHWHGQRQPAPSDPAIVELAGAEGYFAAEYTETVTGDRVSVYWIGGWSRSVAVHTPDACYPGAGFVMQSDIQPFSFDYPLRGADGELAKRSAEMATAVFVKAEPTGVSRLRVFWSWNDGSGWQAPRLPRWEYGGRRPLSKLYLVAASPPGELPHESPSLDLAAELLPELDARLAEAVVAEQSAGE